MIICDSAKSNEVFSVAIYTFSFPLYKSLGIQYAWNSEIKPRHLSFEIWSESKRRVKVPLIIRQPCIKAFLFRVSKLSWCPTLATRWGKANLREKPQNSTLISSAIWEKLSLPFSTNPSRKLTSLETHFLAHSYANISRLKFYWGFLLVSYFIGRCF